jgi:hypothetical protein
MSNIFQVGTHVFNVFESGSGWRISVNGILVEGTFPTRGDAWSAGIGEVDRIERPPGSSLPTTPAGAPGEAP